MPKEAEVSSKDPKEMFANDVREMVSTLAKKYGFEDSNLHFTVQDSYASFTGTLFHGTAVKHYNEWFIANHKDVGLSEDVLGCEVITRAGPVKIVGISPFTSHCPVVCQGSDARLCFFSTGHILRMLRSQQDDSSTNEDH